jgi:hypothetical protein
MIQYLKEINIMKHISELERFKVWKQIDWSKVFIADEIPEEYTDKIHCLILTRIADEESNDLELIQKEKEAF